MGGSDAERLAALGDLGILDTGPEEHLEALCRLAADAFRVPVAAIALAGERDVGLKACHGARVTSLLRDEAFRDRAIRGRTGRAFVAPDLARDASLASNPHVIGDRRLRFYAAVPIALRPGGNPGTLCILDTDPRPDFSAADARRLEDFARVVTAHLRWHETARARAAELQEHRRMSLVLHEREARLRTAEGFQRIAEQVACVGHWRIDAADRTIRWSQGVARIFGRDMPEGGVLDLDTHLSFYAPADRAEVRRRMDAALADADGDPASTFQHRSRITRPDGETRILSVRGLAERDGHGRVTALFGVCVDVTDQARTEQSLREAGELLRATLEHMDQGLLMIGADGRVKVHNRRVRELLDLPEHLLHDGASFPAIRRHQIDGGEFDRCDPAVRAEALADDLSSVPHVYERERPNGVVLEVRSTPLLNGGVVRTFADITDRKAAERALRDNELRYRLLAENTTDVVIWCKLDTTRLYVSPAAKAVFGFEPEELVGTKPLHFVHPDEYDAYSRVLDDIQWARTEQAVSRQRYRRRDGTYVWIEATFSLTRDPKTREPDGYVASLRDISGRKAAEDALRQSEERLALAVKSGNDGLWDWAAGTQSLWFSDRVLTMLGYDPDEIEPGVRTWEGLIHPEDSERATRAFFAHLKGETPLYECEHRLRRKDGTYGWILARGRVVSRDGRGRAQRVIGTHMDITERKEAEQRAAHIARHDALTGLLNRARFRECLDEVLAGLEGRGEPCALLYLDLDRFKTVNDTLGHLAGDALLREVARQFRSVIGERDVAARLGGDEFVVLQLGAAAQPASAASLAERLIGSLNRPITVDGDTVEVGVSVGIALAPRDGRDADTLTKRADRALYRAKAEGRNTYRFYEAAMDETAEEKRRLELDLRGALGRGEFEVHYQPMIDVATGRASGAEALVRWRHPRRGLVSPGDFIPLAEETGLIVPLGEWVLRTACREALSWPDRMRVAVNVSAVQFRQGRVAETVACVLVGSGLAAERLELEITESVLMQDGPEVTDALHRVRDLGVRTALDDFGTGFSSLSYLRRFPFHKLKVDRTFVQGLADAGTRSIVRAIVNLGQGLGMTVTAEGVETGEQLDRVSAEGCDEVQGYLYSQPLPAAQFRAFIADRRRSERAAERRAG